MKKFKEFLKKYWGWFLGTGIFLAIGITTLLVGFEMTGWSIVAWLQSPYAITFFIILAISVLVLIVALVSLKRMKLGGY